MSEAYRIRIFSKAAYDGAALIDAFEADKLAPTHAGKSERALAELDRPAVLAAMASGQTMVIARRKAPRYQVTIGRVKLTSIAVDTALEGERVYALGDRLAAAFHPAYGVLHPKTADGKFSSAGAIEVSSLESYGPIAIGARNWFGPHVAALFGPKRLAAAGIVTKLPWGGVQLDLVEEPWAASVTALKQAQAAAHAALEAAHVLGDYTMPGMFAAGAKWKPIPA